MSKKCIGCGVRLQSDKPDQIGYVLREDQVYCQRCFRIKHYNDSLISMQKGIDNDWLWQSIEAKDALMVWIVDVIDFEASILNGLNRHLIDKDIILVLTKSDLLPLETNVEKLALFIQERLKFHGIKVQAILLCPNLHKQDVQSIESIEEAIQYFRDNRDVVFLGIANAGKSSVLNALLKQNQITTSFYPGTTLDLNPILLADYTMYDTPGFVNPRSLLTHVDEQQLKQVIIRKRMKPKVYQLKGNQSLALAGYARIDLLHCQGVSVICYMSEALTIHRSKQEQADILWKSHLNGLLAPSTNSAFEEMKKYSTSKKVEKLDIVISGLGWVTIIGKVNRIDVYVNEEVDVIFRKAML